MSTPARPWFVLLALVLAVPATGAEHQVGLFGGVNFAKLGFAENGGFGTAAKPAYGGLIEIGIGSALAIRLEPMLLGKGAVVSYVDAHEVQRKLRYDFRYAELPVFLKLGRPAGRLRPYVLLGGTTAYRTKATLTGAPDYEDTVKKWDAGVAGGGGLSLALGSGNVFVEGQYALGLVKFSSRLGHKGARVHMGASLSIGRKGAGRRPPRPIHH